MNTDSTMTVAERLESLSAVPLHNQPTVLDRQIFAV